MARANLRLRSFAQLVKVIAEMQFKDGNEAVKLARDFEIRREKTSNRRFFF